MSGASWRDRLRDRLAGQKTLLRFSSASVLLQVVTMASNLLVLRWVPPEGIGLWQTIVLIQTYSMLLQAGVCNGLNRDLPFALGAGETDEVASLAGTARAVSLWAALLVLVAIPAGALLAGYRSVIWLVGAVTLASASSIYRSYLIVTYRAERAFDALAGIHLVEAAVTVASLALVYYRGLEGLALRFVLIALTGTALNHLYRPLRDVGRFSTAALKRLLATGLPLFSLGYLHSVALTVPRLVLVAEGGVLMVGLFAPASAILNAFTVIPFAIGQYVYPQMSYRLGRTGDPRALWPMARNMALGLVLLSVPAALAGALLVPPLIRWAFPQYIDSIEAVRWVLYAGVLVGARVSANALNSLKAWGRLGAYTALRGATLLLFPWYLYRRTGTLEGFAQGLFVSEAVMFVSCLVLVWTATRRGPAR